MDVRRSRLQVPRAFALTAWATDLSMILLLLGGVFAAARVSFLTFICLLSCFIVYQVYQVWSSYHNGTHAVAMQQMHEEARRALNKAQREWDTHRRSSSLGSQCAAAVQASCKAVGSVGAHVGAVTGAGARAVTSAVKSLETRLEKSGNQLLNSGMPLLLPGSSRETVRQTTIDEGEHAVAGDDDNHEARGVVAADVPPP